MIEEDDMTTRAYREAIDAAAQELSILQGRREELETELEGVQERIEVLQYGLSGLAAVSGLDPKEIYPDLYPEVEAMADIGFTDAVRKVMNDAGKLHLWSPVSIRDELQRKGFDLSKYQNPLASIHTILKRLRESDEVRPSEDAATGKTLYEWNFAKYKFAAFFPPTPKSKVLEQAAEAAAKAAVEVVERKKK